MGPGDERGSCGYCMRYTEIYMHQIGPDQKGVFPVLREGDLTGAPLIRCFAKIEGIWTPGAGLRAQAGAPTKQFLLNSGED